MAVRPFRLALVLAASALSAPPLFAATEGCKVGVLAELPVTMTGTRPMISAKINGEDARFLVDSGAFFSLISEPSAAQYKLDTKATNVRLRGIGGSRPADVTTVREFTLAGIPIKKVQFLVSGSSLGNGAAGVLGQNLLRIADVEYDLAHGVIRLMKPENCKKLNMAYWAKPGDPFSELEIDWATAAQPHTTGTAFLNGKKIRVMLDTGAATSMLSRSAAERAGVSLDSPGVVKSGRMHGIGARAVDTWIGSFASFKIGDEEIKNTKLRIGDTSMDSDMLIGTDFFLSHRIYVASSQRKVYFTFNGGPVFNLTDRPPPGAEPADENPTTTADAPQPEVPEGTPTDAAGFSRRGSAFAARRDYQHALEDLTHACELAPTEPEYFYERGRAYLGNRQPAMAVADFDQVIKLKPDHVPALVTRAGMNMARLEQAGKGFDATTVLADLNKASTTAPKEDDVHLELGTLYSRLGAFGPAIAQYDMWLDTHPTEVRTPEAYANRCRSRAMMGLELDKALSDCNRAVRARDDMPFFLDSRGMVHLRMGNYDKAISDYDAVLKIQPKNPWALYGRGLAKLKKGQKAEGEAQIAAAKASAPRIVAEAERRGLIP